MNHEVMTVGEIATYLRIHQSTVYRLLKRGKLPAFRVGADWRFLREAIDARMVERCEQHNFSKISVVGDGISRTS